MAYAGAYCSDWFMTILLVMKDLRFEEFGSDMFLFKHKENGALVVLCVGRFAHL